MRKISIQFFFLSPNFSFENFIPTDELTPDAASNVNSSNENPIRRHAHRNAKASTQSTLTSTKPSFERPDQSAEKFPNKFNRKQRFNPNQHVSHANWQQASQLINMRSNN